MLPGFRDGDALFLPLFWVHMIERFTDAPFVTFNHFHVEHLDMFGASRAMITLSRALGAFYRSFGDSKDGLGSWTRLWSRVWSARDKWGAAVLYNCPS